MAKEIDERVVEMRFNNGQFEANAKSTLTTLQKLREALNFTKSKDSLKDLGTVAKNANMNQLLTSVTALQKRFSTFGIVGMRAVENVTDSLMGMATKGVRAVTSSIVSGGVRRAMNIENAHFQLQALLKDEEEVQKVMQNAMDSVTDTAYGYDEAAKAASMFAASGMKAGEEMEKALSGISGVAAMTNSDYASMSLIFTTVAGQGRLMGDQLLQLASRGLNAASTLKDYFREVLHMGDVTEEQIRDLVSEGKIDFKTFADAMAWAFGDSAKRANETFNGALSNMKAALSRIGAEFVSPLIEQNGEIVKLFNSLQKKIDVVKKGLTFSDSEKGVVSFSKRFTDSIIAIAGNLRKTVDTVNLNDFFVSLYHLADAFGNVAKGIGTVLGPLGKAFHQVFSKDLTLGNLEKVTSKLEVFTRGLRLSKDSSKNLQDTFKGLFDILRLLSGAAVKAIGVFVPMHKTAGSMIDVFVAITGAIGRTASKIVDLTSKSETLRKTYELISKGFALIFSGAASAVKGLSALISYIYNVPIVQKAIATINDQLRILGTKSYDYLRKGASAIRDFAEKAAMFIPQKVEAGIKKLAESLHNLYLSAKELDLSSPKTILEGFRESLSKLTDMAMRNQGINAFVTNMLEFGAAIKKAFTLDTVIGKVNAFKSAMKSFMDWMREHVFPLFSGMSIGGVAAAGAATGLIFSFQKMAKGMENISKTLKKVPEVLDKFKDTLTAYQNNLKAGTILKIAGAITILAGALVLLSFADTERLVGAVTELTVVGGLFIGALAMLGRLADKSKDTSTAGQRLADGVNSFAENAGKALNDLAKALKIKAIGSMVKDFGTSMLMIAGSLIVLGLMYRKDAKSMNEAALLALKIAGVMTAIMAGMMLMQRGSNGLSSAAKMLGPVLAMLAISVSLIAVIKALKKLFKIELPEDWKTKLLIMTALFGMLGGVTLLLGIAGKMSGGAKASTAPILVMATGLAMIIGSLKKLFKMEFPEDWKVKIGVLSGLLIGLTAAVAAIGILSKGGGANVKAAATIVAMCTLLGATVAALMVLSVFPLEKLAKAAAMLGITLLAVGGALFAASKITDPAAAESVLAMSAVIGAIASSLSILSIIPWQGLAKAALAIGAVLLALALNFNQIGKMSENTSGEAVESMVKSVRIIAQSLIALSIIPWPKLLAASAALSAVLLSLTASYHIMSKGTVDKEAVTRFLASTIALVPVTAALWILASRPWDSLLASAAALSAVLLALTLSFNVISKSSPNVAAIGMFLLASTSLVAIGAVLFVLAQSPWQNILAAAGAVSLVLLSLTGAFAICTVIGAAAGAAIAGIAMLDLFIANFAAVLAALGYIFQNDAAQALLAGGATVLSTIGKAIGDFVGSIVGGAIEAVGSSLVSFGMNLSQFMMAMQPFFTGAKMIDEGSMSAIGSLVKAIMLITAADFITGIASFFGVGGGDNLVKLGQQLVAFAPSISQFANTVSGIDPKALDGASAAVDIMAKMAKSVPLESGILGAIMGDRMDLGTFGGKLVQFGSAMKEFTATTTGITSASVQEAADAAGVLIALSKDIPTSGGLMGMLFGNKGLGSFSTNLVSFGYAISEFSKKVANVSTGKIDSVTKSMNNFIKMAKAANKTSAKGLKDLSNSMNSVAEDVSGSYAKSISGQGSKVGEAMGNVVSSAISGVNAKSSELKKEGEKASEKYISGINSKKGKSRTTGTKIASEAISGIKSRKNEFEKSGKYAGEGYIKGLKSKISAANAAGKKLAAASQKGTKKENQEGSPSKIFETSGVFAGAGYIIGLTKMALKSNKAGQELAAQSIDGTKLGLSRINRIFDSLDANPIITPKIDLSGIEQGAVNMRSMFNDAINVTARAAGSVTVSERKDSISDLTSAIRDLTIGNSEKPTGNSYTINGLNYNEGSDVADAIETLIHATVIQGRA